MQIEIVDPRMQPTFGRFHGCHLKDAQHRSLMLVCGFDSRAARKQSRARVATGASQNDELTSSTPVVATPLAPRITYSPSTNNIARSRKCSVFCLLICTSTLGTSKLCSSL